ncbi:MAG: hypothetical protein ACMUHY_03185 [Thermoplasmatota archaeon]
MEDPEAAAFELWKGLRPGDAYVSGIDDAGGRLFVPTRDNIRSIRSTLDSIWRSTLDVSMRSLLRWARCDLDLREPQRPPKDIYRTLVGHIIKGGVHSPLLHPLIRDSSVYVDHAISDLRISRWPLEVQFQTLRTIGSLKDLLSALPLSSLLKEPVSGLVEKLTAYEELFPIGEIMKASHEEVISALESGEGHVGRGDIYQRIIGELYAFPERTNSLEEALVLDLYGEIPNFKRIREEMSDLYGTEVDMDDIDIEMASQRRIRVPEVMEVVERLREHLNYWAIRSLIDYPHEMDVGVLETPSYLRSHVADCSMVLMDGLPAKPRTDLLITLDPARYRPFSFPDLVRFLADQELGARAQYLNSYVRPLDPVPGTDLLPDDIISSVSRGFALNRQLDVLGMFKDMSARRPELMKAEKYLVDHIEEVCTLEELTADLDFLVTKERMMSLIKAVADVRLNSGKQSIPEFMRWAHIITGIREPILFEAIMEAVSRPGFQAVSMSLSSGLRELSEIMLNKGVSLIDFNTHSTRMGFPSWRYLRERILEI